MVAQKVVRVNTELEVERLTERVRLLESVIDYSTAETLNGLKEKVKDLETEAITLRVRDTEKDKLIAEKDKRIAEIQNNFESRLNSQLKLQQMQHEADKAQSLSDQRKNIRQREVKPEREKVEQAKEEVDRIQHMYESLLEQFNKSHENETTIINMCSEILTVVKQLIVSGETAEKVIDQIDKGVESLQQYSIEEECEIIHNFLENGYTNKEIAAYLWPGLKRGQSKVTERKESKYYIDKYGIRP